MSRLGKLGAELKASLADPKKRGTRAHGINWVPVQALDALPKACEALSTPANPLDLGGKLKAAIVVMTTLRRFLRFASGPRSTTIETAARRV